MADRRADLARFYALLDRLARVAGGPRRLSACSGRMDWPTRGVYFLFENGERRSVSGEGPRVVRVGTHALKSGARSTLWGRLSQHRGSASMGGGNHRGSIFRLLVGAALMRRAGEREPASWGIGNDPGAAARRLGLTRAEVRERERALERRVSAHIGAMEVLWLPVRDAPGPESLRGYIERNAIALLSAASGNDVDPPSSGWLGHHSDRERVRHSGLWNNDHVEALHEQDFLDVMEALVVEWEEHPQVRRMGFIPHRVG